MDVDLVVDNEKLVYSIINKFRGYFDMDDLYQVGMIGLINASKNFNKGEGVKFSTYAYTYVFGEVNKYIRENNNLKIGKDAIRLKKSIEKAKDIMRQKLLREPTTLEVSLFLDMPLEKVLEIESIKQETKSLDYIGEEDSNNLYNTFSFENKEMNPEILDLKTELENLDNDEKKLIYSRYYLDMTQQETSKEMGMSQVQVYRKEAKIFKKLKSRL